MTQSPTTTPTSSGNRWLVLAGAVLVQLSIGAVYAWSTFSKAFQDNASAMHLSKVQASIPFEFAIGMIFVGSFLGGRLQDRRGPRIVAIAGVIVYAIGIVLASFARTPDQLWLLILGYGVLSGFGLGLAYIVPIAMLQKWFPERRGLITGIAVGGFGFGAVITSPVAQHLIDGSADYTKYPAKVFLLLGIAYLIAGLIGASVFRNPDHVPAVAPVGHAADHDSREYAPGEALRTPQWFLLTAILTLSVMTGIALISLAASTATEVAGMSKTAAATLVGVMGLFNGGGRIMWAAVSDRIGRMPAFMGILGIEGVCLLLVPHVHSAGMFYVLAALIYLCYGGGFGTMPSTAGDFFGVRHAGAIYGLMLIAWSLGGVVGPLLISALIGESKAYTLGYTVMGVIALAALVLPLITKPPAARRTTTG